MVVTFRATAAAPAIVRVGLLAAALAVPAGAWAQRIEKPATEPAAAMKDASVGRSAVRATTYKIGTATINLGLLTFALGSATGGTVLAAGTAVTSWLLYTANDYLWDYYSPLPAPVPGQPYDAAASAARTTQKFIVYKPIGMAQKFAWLYAYTGNVATTATWGTATAAANAVWYYANEMAWDWYDWQSAAKASAAQR